MMHPKNAYPHVRMGLTVMSFQFNVIVCLVQANVCYVRVLQKTSADNVKLLHIIYMGLHAEIAQTEHGKTIHRINVGNAMKIVKPAMALHPLIVYLVFLIKSFYKKLAMQFAQYPSFRMTQVLIVLIPVRK